MFASVQSRRRPTLKVRRLSMLFMLVLALSLAALFVALTPLHVAHASSGQAPWWSGDCDNGDPTPDGLTRGTLITTDPTLGVQICYPYNWNGLPSGQKNYTEQTPHGVATLAEWQCVEFSARYLEQVRNMPNEGGVNGAGVANAYYNWYKGTVSGLSLIYGGTTQMFPSPGDVLSTTSGGDSSGHTGVVNYVHIDDAVNGNGYVMIAQENTSSGGANAGWTPDGTSVRSAWGDNSWPYTKLVVRNWSYYNDDSGSSYPTQSEDNVQILHFGAPTNSNPIISTKLVYAIGTDTHGNSHLYEFWPDSKFTSWSARDLNTTTGEASNLVGNPSADWLKQSGQIVHDIFATGTDGQIHEFYYMNNAWTYNDLAKYNGSYNPTFTQSPFGYSYYDSSNNPHHAVYVVGTDGNLYEYSWPSSSIWGIALTAPPSGTTFTGTPTAYAYDTNGYQLVYVITSDGKLREYSNPIGNTGSMNLINTFSLPNGYSASGQPSAYSYSDAAGTHHFVYVKGSNGQVYGFYYDPSTSTWNYSSPAALLPSGVVPTGSPNVHPSFESATPIQFGFVTDSAGSAYEVYSQSNTPSSWSHVGGGTDPDGYNVTGSPDALTFIYSGTTTHNVFASEDDGNIHLEYYPYTVNNKTSWNWTTITTSGSQSFAGVSFTGATPSAYVVPVGA